MRRGTLAQAPNLPQVSWKQILEALRKAWEESNFENLSKRLAGWLFKNFATSEALKWAIENNVDPVYETFNHYHAGHPAVAPLARWVFKMAWSELDKYTDYPFIYSELTKNPENATIINTPEGLHYLQRCVEISRTYLHVFTWETCPQCSNPLKWSAEYNLLHCEQCKRNWGLGNY